MNEANRDAAFSRYYRKRGTPLVLRDAELPLTAADRLAQYAVRKANIPELRDVSAIPFGSPVERALHGLRVALETFSIPVQS